MKTNEIVAQALRDQPPEGQLRTIPPALIQLVTRSTIMAELRPWRPTAAWAAAKFAEPSRRQRRLDEDRRRDRYHPPRAA